LLRKCNDMKKTKCKTAGVCGTHTHTRKEQRERRLNVSTANSRLSPSYVLEDSREQRTRDARSLNLVGKQISSGESTIREHDNTQSND
jgi:hypothetical protein